MDEKLPARTAKDLVSREELCQAFRVARSVVDRLADLRLWKPEPPARVGVREAPASRRRRSIWSSARI